MPSVSVAAVKFINIISLRRMKNRFHCKITSLLKLIFTVIFLALFGGCQNSNQKGAILLASDKTASAELKRINSNLAAGQNVSQPDIDSLNSLREKYPEAAEVRQTLQAALIRREDWATVEKIIVEMPEREKTNADKLNLAKIYLKLGEYEKAAGLLNSLTADKTIEVEAKSLLGQAQFYLGQINEAAQTIDSIWNEIVAGKKTDEMTLRGMIYFRQNKLDEAVETLKKVLDIEPENISANNTLSRIYSAKGDTANAEIYLNKAQAAHEKIAALEKKKTKLVPLYYQLEDAYKAKKYDEVISIARQILPDADEKNQTALYQYLANAYQAQGNQVEAENAMRKAAELQGK